MNFLVILVYVLLSFSVGFFLIGLSLNLLDLTFLTFFSSYLEKQLSELSSRLIFALLGILIVILCLKYLQIIFFHSQRRKSIKFELPEGKVSITLFAIEDMLKKMLEGREIFHIKPKIISSKKEVEVVIRGDLTSEVNLIELTKEIQEKVKERLQRLLGEDKQIKIEIEIRKMIFKGKKEIEEELKIPFRNY